MGVVEGALTGEQTMSSLFLCLAILKRREMKLVVVFSFVGRACGGQRTHVGGEVFQAMAGILIIDGRITTVAVIGHVVFLFLFLLFFFLFFFFFYPFPFLQL